MPPDEEPLAAARGYLLFLAEQYLDGDLHAKAGASDLVQATLLAAHSSRGQYQGTSDAQFKGWLRGILRNVLRKFRRHWSRRGRAAHLEVPLYDDLGFSLPPDNQETPSSQAARVEQHRLLADALARLTPEQRQVVAWRVEQALPFADIGARLGKSADAVRFLFHRALERLRGLLGPESAAGREEP